MTGDSRLPQTVLQEGLALLDEQHQAMLARDADRIEAANVRLSAWIAACRQASVDAGSTADLPRLRAALVANAGLSQRAAQQAMRAFEALVAPEQRTYTDQGLLRQASLRRQTSSA
jgi:hypothetical protein